MMMAATLDVQVVVAQLMLNNPLDFVDTMLHPLVPADFDIVRAWEVASSGGAKAFVKRSSMKEWPAKRPLGNVAYPLLQLFVCHGPSPFRLLNFVGQFRYTD